MYSFLTKSNCLFFVMLIFFIKTKYIHIKQKYIIIKAPLIIIIIIIVWCIECITDISSCYKIL